MTEESKGHPWADFLEARKRALVWLRDDQKETPEAIARAMCMDPMQVILILMHADDAARPPAVAPPTKRKCNKHDDCDAADASAAARGVTQFGRPGAYHCSVDDCEDCFGC